MCIFSIFPSKTVPFNIIYRFNNVIGFVNYKTVQHCNSAHQDNHVEDLVKHTALFFLKVAYSRYDKYAIINPRSRIKMVDESVVCDVNSSHFLLNSNNNTDNK